MWLKATLLAVLMIVGTDSKRCFKKSVLKENERYFDCSNPTIELSDEENNIIMDFRNKEKLLISKLIFNTENGSKLETETDQDEPIKTIHLPLKENKMNLELNIYRDRVYARIEKTENWNQLEITKKKKTIEISYLSFRTFPPNPAFCITCRGEHIWNNTTPLPNEPEVSGANTGLWWLCLLVVPVLFLCCFCYERKRMKEAKILSLENQNVQNNEGEGCKSMNNMPDEYDEENDLYKSADDYPIGENEYVTMPYLCTPNDAEYTTVDEIPIDGGVPACNMDDSEIPSSQEFKPSPCVEIDDEVYWVKANVNQYQS